MGYQSVRFSWKEALFEYVTPTCWSPSWYLSMDTDCASILFKPGALQDQAAGNDLQVTTSCNLFKGSSLKQHYSSYWKLQSKAFFFHFQQMSYASNQRGNAWSNLAKGSLNVLICKSNVILRRAPCFTTQTFTHTHTHWHINAWIFKSRLATLGLINTHDMYFPTKYNAYFTYWQGRLSQSQ